MMDDLKILESVERYIGGEMNPDERLHFENLRKSNPEIDQMVVEHTFFLQQMNRFDETRKLKSVLNDIHIDLAEKGAIEFPKLKGKAKVIYLFNRYKKVAGIAASIAGLTALTISALMWSISSPVKQKNDIEYLSGKINAIEKQNTQQQREINNVKKYVAPSTAVPVPTQPDIEYKTGGTGFLISSNGFLATNAHVVKSASHIAVQNSEGKDFHAKVIHIDIDRDLAILKIEDSSFKAPSSLPYSIKRSTGEIAESVYTLGYPRNDVVYGEGYLAAKTGFNGDTLTCQIAIAANPGNSGGPVINKNGEVIGILSARQTSAEGVVFATKSKYIYTALDSLQKDNEYKNIKTPAASSMKSLNREQQVKKVVDFVYMVKVS